MNFCTNKYLLKYRYKLSIHTKFDLIRNATFSSNLEIKHDFTLKSGINIKSHQKTL